MSLLFSDACQKIWPISRTCKQKVAKVNSKERTQDIYDNDPRRRKPLEKSLVKKAGGCSVNRRENFIMIMMTGLINKLRKNRKYSG